MIPLGPSGNTHASTVNGLFEASSFSESGKRTTGADFAAVAGVAASLLLAGVAALFFAAFRAARLPSLPLAAAASSVLTLGASLLVANNSCSIVVVHLKYCGSRPN